MAAEAKNPAGLPSISIIIPALNPGPELAECLEPLRSSPYPRFYPCLIEECLGNKRIGSAEKREVPFDGNPD
jgi:cellulose synthase/poly-beta-1,6-N-acetylglucosamine synthase-like glycosyltransferase